MTAAIKAAPICEQATLLSLQAQLERVRQLAQHELDTGSATGSGVTLAKRVIAICEGTMSEVSDRDRVLAGLLGVEQDFDLATIAAYREECCKAERVIAEVAAWLRAHAFDTTELAEDGSIESIALLAAELAMEAEVSRG